MRLVPASSVCSGRYQEHGEGEGEHFSRLKRRETQLVPKLRIGSTGTALTDGARNGVSRKCVPKPELGNEERTTEFGDD